MTSRFARAHVPRPTPIRRTARSSSGARFKSSVFRFSVWPCTSPAMPQTSVCMYLSIIVLAGLALNALLGWWWADPVAALCVTPIIVKEASKVCAERNRRGLPMTRRRSP